jgi:hypothetical protein
MLEHHKGGSTHRARTQGSRRASWKGAPAASTPLDDAPASPSARFLARAPFQLVKNTQYITSRTLTITSSGGSSTVAHGADQITLNGVDDVTADDFWFAAGA